MKMFNKNKYLNKTIENLLVCILKETRRNSIRRFRNEAH